MNLRQWFEQLGRYGVLLALVIRSSASWRSISGRTAFQLHFIGARSLAVIVLTGLFLGLVVAIQFHDTLARFGSRGLLGQAVMLSLMRELAPVLTGLMLIARAGSALCAEVAIMRGDNQIDALECMGVAPHRFILAPMFWGGVIAGPMLTAICLAAGALSGALAAATLFDIPVALYFGSLRLAVTATDLWMCAVKAFVFSALGIWICLAKGYLMHYTSRAHRGSVGVSQTTTSAVVTAAISLLFADFVISALMV
jgi:phospholipid/cholesterol/gamma-HCH transport system permease protein